MNNNGTTYYGNRKWYFIFTVALALAVVIIMTFNKHPKSLSKQEIGSDAEHLNIVKETLQYIAYSHSIASFSETSRSVQSNEETLPPVENPLNLKRTIEKGTRKFIVYVVWSHYPEMLKVQVEALRNFMKDLPMYYIAINVATGHRWHHFKNVIEQLGVGMFIYGADRDKLSPDHVNTFDHSLGMMAAYEYSLDTELIGQNDVILFLDSDMFPMQSISVDSAMGSHSMLSLMQSRSNKYGVAYEYPWLNFVMFDLKNIPNSISSIKALDWHGCRFGTIVTDSGGCSSLFLLRYPDVFNARVGMGMKDCAAIADTADFSGNRQLTFLKEQCAIPKPAEQCAVPSVLEVPAETAPESPTLYIYHIGSGGSNWRRCDEAYMASRRMDLIRQLNHWIIGA